LEDLGVDESTILNQTLKKSIVRGYIEETGLGTRFRDGLL
jgi:hypothetical protein